MGFWSKFAKIALPVAAGAATIFTGGAASPALAAALKGGALAGAAGSALKGISGSKTKNREAEINHNLLKDQFGLVAQKQFEESQNNAYKNARRSAYAKNFAPVAPPSHIYNAFSNYKPSAEAVAADDAMYRQAMIQLLEGKKAEMTPMKKAGFWENFLGAAGLGLGAVGEFARTDVFGGNNPPVNYGRLRGDYGDF